ncbi:hypothetical protein DFJ58DRAFT_736309 [Suillus subalutaceus]|uniref:uncharacterized protein n=1 Tax=Suillus subalutaceus TaxID=48586 RepID=UPI001B877F66|nr:uncharacterized protein DFJ58DRAFT_736309 [Suillus subalutaceus]KAG1832580.1 hypothetical protein DFJ58DRAFT_736309 [Suillus subalutaceus]
MVGYHSHRINFLWVRWYQYLDIGCPSRQAPLDRVYFPPTAEPDSFGFVDPDDVLRCCHIIPCFSQGLQHLDGRGISHCAQDKLDWKSYYINRFVDQDAFMRYQWGLEVGHTYAHATMRRQEDEPTVMQDFEDLEEGGYGSGCGMSNSGSNSESEESDSDWGSASDGGCGSDSNQSLDYEN